VLRASGGASIAAVAAGTNWLTQMAGKHGSPSGRGRQGASE
jgi:hypothetical protein